MSNEDLVAQANVHFREALELKKAGKDALEAYNRGIAIHPVEWALQNRGWIHFERGDFAAALADWSACSDEYAFPRGRAKLALGDFDGAIADFEKAMADDPDPETQELLDEARAKKGGTPPKKVAAAKGEGKAPAAPPKPVALPKRKKGEGYDEWVARALASLGLSAPTLKAIDALRKTAFVAAAKASAPKEVGASRIGGDPDLPPGTKWPRASGKPLSFVAQVRLEDLAKVQKSALPKKGLLSFFVSEADGSYLEKAAVLLSDTKKLERTPPPDGFERMADGELLSRGYKARGLTFEVVKKVPAASHPSMKKVKWADGERALYEKLFDASIEQRNQVLGYRDRAYDAEQKESTLLLFQCASQGDMSWGDEDDLYFYVGDKALAAGDFSKVFASCGD